MKPGAQIFPGLLALMLACLTPHAFAKKITLRWEPAPDAHKYELRILRGDKVVLSEKLPGATSSWTWDLKPGKYEYQIRVLDKLDQPSNYTESNEFVIPPGVPRPIEPRRDSVIEIESDTATLTFKWKAGEGSTSHALQILQDKKVILSETLSATEWTAQSLAPGKYQWQVKALLSLPASKSSDSPKSAESAFSDPEGFEIQKKTPQVAPAPAAPLVAVPEPTPAPTPDPETEMLITAALAKPSIGSRILGKDEMFSEDAKTNVNVSMGLKPYYYRISSLSSGFDGDVTSVAGMLSIQADYWRFPRLGVFIRLEDTWFHLQGISFDRYETEFGVKYRAPIAQSVFSFQAHLGLGFREHFIVNPITTSLTELMSFGPTLYLGVGRKIGTSNRVSLGFNAFIPGRLVRGPENSRINGSGPKEIYSLGFYGHHPIFPKYALRWALQFSYERMSFYLSNNSNSDDTLMYTTGAQVSLAWLP